MFRVFRTAEFNKAFEKLDFLVYDDNYAVLAAAISDKKAQQATIETILQDLSRYKQYVIEISNKEKAI